MAYGARLESVLGESPRGFESPILRQETPGDAQHPQPGIESPILRKKHRVTRSVPERGSNPPSSAAAPRSAAPSAIHGRLEWLFAELVLCCAEPGREGPGVDEDEGVS